MFQTLMRWLSTDNKSILFAEGNSKHERYHGFHLYKAIARFCKDTAVPRKELEVIPFQVPSAPLSECLCIDV
jgi:hypothetical protein